MAFQGDPFEAMEKRNLRNQNPETKPGMGSPSVWGAPKPGNIMSPPPNPFQSQPSSSTPSPFSPARPPFGGGTPQGNNTVGEQISQQAVEVGTKAVKHVGVFTKEFVVVSKQHNYRTISDAFAKGVYSSLVVGGIGIVSWAVSFFLPPLHFGYYLLISGMLCFMVNLIGFGIFRHLHITKGDELPPKPVIPEPPTMPTFPPEPVPMEDDYEEEEDDFEDEWEDFEDEVEEEEVLPPAEETVDYGSLEEVEIPEGTQTRAFLFEHSMKGLPSFFPGFDKLEEVDEDDPQYALIEEYVQESAELVGTKEMNLPEVLGIRENYFVVLITITRTPNLKTQAIAQEIVNLYKFDALGEDVHPHAFATVKEFGNKALITLFKGSEPRMIGLKEMSQQVKNQILNVDNIAPMVWGTSAEGKVYFTDFIKVTSLVISGAPRSGKGWLTKLILNQMCTYLSPDDLEIYIGDPKDGVSDYVDYDMPHVKRREFTVDGVNNMLLDIMTREVVRRKKIFKEKGFKEIFEFRRNCPDIKMPFMYIVLDEMSTIATSMSKADEQGYKDLLLQIVSQTPALGIRAIFIPHRVKNEIIPKNVYELIPYRATAKCSGKELLENLGFSKADEFPYLLSQTGEFGLSIADLNQGKGSYCRNAIIAVNNTEMAKYERYIASMWRKLCPTPTPDVPEMTDTEVQDMFDWSDLE